MAVATTLNQVAIEIQNHMNQCGGSYREWYVGIASDVRKRLFMDHNVHEKGDAWIFRDCGMDMVARSVEKYFIDKGCDGGSGGGDQTTKYVYAYRKAPHTRQ